MTFIRWVESRSYKVASKNPKKYSLFRFVFPTQKSYKKSPNKKAASGIVQNGKANGHIVQDLNHNEVVTKPNSGKKNH